MGNVVSRCVQNVRNTMTSCSRKQEDEPMLTSTYDSEAADKYNGPCFDPSVSLIDQYGDEERVSHGPIDGGSESPAIPSCERAQLAQYYLKSSTPKSRFNNPGSQGYVTLSPDEDPTDGNNQNGRYRYDSDGKRHLLVDKGIQTGMGVDICISNSSRVSPETSQGLSKEFIIKTYSIKNATPSPTIPAKFESSKKIKFPRCNSSEDELDLSPICSPRPDAHKANVKVTVTDALSPEPIIQASRISTLQVKVYYIILL